MKMIQAIVRPDKLKQVEDGLKQDGFVQGKPQQGFVVGQAVGPAQIHFIAVKQQPSYKNKRLADDGKVNTFHRLRNVRNPKKAAKSAGRKTAESAANQKCL